MFRARITRQLTAAADPDLSALYAELLSPSAADEPGPPTGSEALIPMIVRIDGHRLALFSTTTSFSTPLDVTLDEVMIESYYPADAESTAYFTGRQSTA